MPIITGKTTIAGSGQSPNVIEGSSFEFILNDALVIMSAITVGNSANTDDDDVQVLFQIGGVTLIQPPFGLIFSNPPTTAIPNDLYHNYIRTPAASGARLFMTFLNNESTSVVVNWIIRIDPV